MSIILATLIVAYSDFKYPEPDSQTDTAICSDELQTDCIVDISVVKVSMLRDELLGVKHGL